MGATRISLAENFWASKANSGRRQGATQRSTVPVAAKGSVANEPQQAVQFGVCATRALLPPGNSDVGFPIWVSARQISIFLP